MQAYRGSILHFLSAPTAAQDESSYQYFADGLLVVEKGHVKLVGDYAKLKSQLTPEVELIDYSGYLLMPGFIDAHLHYPQLEMIASYGEQLIEWLDNYVFPAESKYSDSEYARKMAQFFLQELLRNGTTTAAVYPTVHKTSAEMFFQEALKLNMRMLAGKVLMDRNARSDLLDTPESAYDDSKELIVKWHGKERLLYAVTPRFAPTSTAAQLEVAAALMQEFPTVYLQTHLAENRNEVTWVQELFPWSKDYTDVYDHFGLLGERSLFCHAIHLSEREWLRLHATKSVLCWCPISNFFLGSGLFSFAHAKELNVRISLATDVGGGSSFSMFRVLNEAYKTAALQGARLSPLESFYYLTLGNAKALTLADKIGNFVAGKEADFVVLDMYATPLLQQRMRTANTLYEQLFALNILGDDRAIKATYIMGELLHAAL